MKMRKVLAMACAMALTAAIAIGGTIAYLTDRTDAVVNTFTVGNVKIDLTETFNKSTNNEGSPDRWEKKMVPGDTLEKDPTVKVNAGSEACYLFLKVTDSVEPKLSDYIEYTLNSAWLPVDGHDGYYYQVVQAEDAAKGQEYNVLVDDKVTVKTTVTQAMMDSITTSGVEPTLTFVAAAVQSAGLDNVGRAFAELPTDFTA